MAPSETPSAETNEKDSTHAPLSRSSSEERAVLNGTFRSQYHRLHRSHGVNNNVSALKCRFEAHQEVEVAQVPKPKVPLVDKAESDLGSGVKEEIPEPGYEEIVIEEEAKVQEDKKNESVLREGLTSEGLEPPVSEQSSVVLEEKPVIIQRRGAPTHLKAAPPVPQDRSELKPIKKVLKKSLSDTESSTPIIRKRVSFSFDNNDKPPVPKPRNSLPIQQVIIETIVIEPDKISQVETVRLSESTQSDLDKIEFAEPEPRHHIIRNENTSLGSVENIKKVLDGFTMESKKKRSPSFKSKFLTIFSKDKDKKPKEKDENKKTKKTENAVFADNAQNENFNRHSTQRHTIDTPRREPKPMQSIQLQNHQQSFHEGMHPDQKDMEHRYAAMHIQNYQQARNTFEASQLPNQPMHQPLLRKVSQDHGVYNPNEDYVCMDNKNEAKNYINLPSLPKYDSSSTNTIESENSTTSVNPLQQIQQERMAIRSKFFNETGTPPRGQETNQNVQLVNPKAAIPINSERPLPNPYQQSQPSPQARNDSPYRMQPQLQIQDENDLADSGYGTVYDRNSRPISAGSSDISGGSMNSPRSPGVERTKLKLPQNRERMDLQPRLKSPIPPSEVSTDKLIATELLKTNKKGDKKDKDRSSPSHQKLQLEIDYPDLHETICDVVEQAGNSGRSSRNQNHLNQNELSITSFHKNDMSSSSFNVTDNNVHSNNVSTISNGNISGVNETEVSRETLLEAGDWHRVQRDLTSSPLLKNVQITTNALVHVDPQNRANTPSQDGRSRSVTPVMMMRKNSMSSLQRSPPKHEIRQTVEAFCWKELKKLKEQEDQQMQLIVGPMISSCGYAEDPIRRSRSMAVTPRDTKRSTSLPREVRPRRVEDMELNARRMAQQQRFNTGPQRNTDSQTRPIFNRGSLTQQNAIEQPIYSKKVSFRSQNTQNPGAWPTKNGFTQSPPQRRLEAEGTANGNKERDSLEDDVFMPQTPKEQPPPSRDEIFLLNQQRQKELLLAKAQRSTAPVTVDGNGSVADNASVISEVPPMRNIREPIYGTRPPVPMHGTMTNQAMNESPYGTRNTINDPTGRPGPVNEPIYGSRNGGMPRASENPYGTRNTSPNGYTMQNGMRNENPYGTRQVNESPYGTRHVQNESPYGTRPPPPNRSMNESPYGSRMYPNGMPPREEPIYGSKPPPMMQQESMYGSRPSMVRDPIYGSRPLPPPGMDNIYGARQNPNGQRYLPGYPPPGHQEPIYGSRGIPPPSNAEGMYGYRMGNGSIRSESPYGSRPSLPMGPNQQYYNRPRLSPSAVGPPLPPGGPGRAGMPPGLRRSNSLRQPESPESLYSGRPNFSKPPSGAQYRQRPSPHQMDISPPGQRQPEPPQGRYDFPPPDSPPRQGPPMSQEPIYGTRKMNTVNNKVCDMYGKIYDANKPGLGPGPGQVPMSPPPIQKAGVLYGQLQRNSNAPPMVYQSHQQLQASNFQRGTRLTASVNDMHRYNSNVNVGPSPQRTEPPSRPLPPIPDEQQQQQQQQKKSRFGFGRKKNESKGK